MCLGELAEVTAVTGDGTAQVRSDGRALTVSLLTLDEMVAPGDWLLTHAGFALSRLTRDQALEAARIRSAVVDQSCPLLRDGRTDEPSPPSHCVWTP